VVSGFTLIDSTCIMLGVHKFRAARFCAVAPNVCLSLVILLCDPSNAYNIEVAARFLGSL